MSRSQLLSALSNWLAFAATLAVAFALTPVLIAHLGPERYGIWSVAEAILAYFTLLDMGLAACLVRGVARQRTDAPALNRMASTCLALFSFGGLLALTIGTPVMFAVSLRFGCSVDVILFLLVMLFNLAITLPLSVFPSVLDGLERYTTKSVVRVVFLIVRTVATVMLLNFEASLLPLALIFTAVTIAEHAAFAVLAFRFLPTLRLRRTLVDRASVREIRAYSIDAFLAMLAGRITTQTGIILIGLFLPTSQVMIFGTPAKLVDYAKTLLRTITATLTPGVSALEACGDWPALRALFLSATRLVLAIVLPIQLGLFAFGTPFLVRWVPQVGDAGSRPLFILSTTLTLAVAQSVASRFLYGLGRLKLFARLALGEAALNALLLATLIPAFGLTGVALAVAIPNLIFSVAVIVYTLRVIGVPLTVYLKVWCAPLLASCIPAAIWIAMPPVTAEWSAIATAISLGLLPYALAVALNFVAARSVFLRIARRKASWSSRR